MTESGLFKGCFGWWVVWVWWVTQKRLQRLQLDSGVIGSQLGINEKSSCILCWPHEGDNDEGVSSLPPLTTTTFLSFWLCSAPGRIHKFRMLSILDFDFNDFWYHTRVVTLSKWIHETILCFRTWSGLCSCDTGQSSNEIRGTQQFYLDDAVVSHLLMTFSTC